MVGRVLSHYKVLDRIGVGGMGEVYRALDLELEREVALKVLPEEVASQPDRVARFRREAKMVAALNHPNIVTLYSVEEADDVLFLTMELVEGRTLASLIDEGPLELRRFFRIAIPLVSALVVAHDRGVAHRDLKPHNVMLGPGDRVKVLDFGLAKLLAPQRHGFGSQAPTEFLTQPGHAFGTPAYSAPEVLAGAPADHRADVFALGVILFEMATGRYPFRGRTPNEVMASILRDSPPAVTALDSRLPRQLDRILARALEKDPERRFRTARGLQAELEALREELGAGVWSTGALESEAALAPARTATVTHPGARPEAPAALSSWRRVPGGSRALPVAAGVVAVVVALGVGVAVRREGQEAAAPVASQGLAVLPFANLTGDPSQEYLAEGVAASLITRLSELQGLRVVSRAEVWRHRRESLSASEWGKLLAVDVLLEGDVAAQAERLRVSVRLTDARSGRVLRASRYEGERREVLGLQSEIASGVADFLAVSLSGTEQARLARDPTRSYEAYDVYLKGHSYLDDPSDEHGPALAAEAFRQALRIDPGFALGHVGLSEALWRLYQGERDSQHLDAAEAEAQLALELDPALPAAQVAMARVERSRGRTQESIAKLEAILAAHPRPDQAQRELAISYAVVGDLERASECWRAAIALSGDSWFNWNGYGGFLVESGQYEQARSAYLRAAELAPPGNTWPQENLAAVELYQGNFAAAITAFEAIQTPTRSPSLASNIGTAYFFVGELDKAETQYRLAVRLAPQDPLLRRNLGDLYLRQGRQDAAREEYREALALVSQRIEGSPADTKLHLEQVLYAAKAEECERALELGAQLDQERAVGPDAAHMLAQAYALCGAREPALQALGRAIQGGFSASLVRVEDEFLGLREDPEFQALTAAD